MQQHELFEFLLDTFAELATLHAAAAASDPLLGIDGLQKR